MSKYINKIKEKDRSNIIRSEKPQERIKVDPLGFVPPNKSKTR